MLTVIMAGGVGTRFWPQSRLKRPKQLMNLTGQGSMIRLTVDRLKNISKADEIFVITNVEQVEAIKEEIPGIPAENIIAEPVGKNTAPCIGLACVLMRKRFGDQPVLVLPADHIIGDIDRFEAAVRSGAQYARKHKSILTFGITPSRPETGYGYIHVGNQLDERDGVEIYQSKAFLEKPDLKTAELFCQDGSYYWNSGMFLWDTGVILDAISRHIPELHQVLTDIEQQIGTKEIEEVLNSLYPIAPSVSIDYGVMEKAENVAVIKGDFYWNDVGNWESIRELFTADENQNIQVGDHIIVEGRGNTIFSPEKLVSIIGLDDVVVVDGGDAILVCHRQRTQDVRKIVDLLRSSGKEDLT